MVDSFESYITESFSTFVHGRDVDAMHAHKDEVYSMLNAAYEKIGGIKGNGFKSPDDMVDNIHMWKIRKHEGRIVAAAMYKQSNGRKRVVVACDGTDRGKHILGEIIHHDTVGKRAWGEISGPSLSFSKKHLAARGHQIKPHALPVDHVKKLFDGEEIRPVAYDDPEVQRHPELREHFYQRNIGGHWHTKIAIGTPHKHIV